MYQGCEEKEFEINGRKGILVVPPNKREDGVYIWRTEFLGAFDMADRALLERGWCLAYYAVSDCFGAPAVIEEMRRFQAYLEEEFHLCPKAVLFGFSRGGLYAVNYAAAYPEKVRKLYLDAPVLDIFSWPAGFGRGEGSAEDWEMCRKIYGITEDGKNCDENPIEKIPVLTANRIPVILVAGDADTVVPFNENGKILYADYMYAGAEIKLILKKGAGHHPHSLEDPQEIADWIEFDREFGCIIDEGAADWQIFQQKDGFADIRLCGRCVNRSDMKEYHAFARAVSEDDGSNVTPWKKCDMSGDQWSVELRVPAGGLYRIETCMDENEDCTDWSLRGDMIHHVGVGDVFVIAGQSNSAGYGKDPVTDQPDLEVHLLKNSGEWGLASHPMNDSTHTFHPQNRDGANTGHSPYLSFAKYLRRTLGYPVGLVQTALGGSPLIRWSRGNDLYRNLIKTVQSLPGIKGILWYQGCSDVSAGDCDSYEERFAKFVSDVREELEAPELPFFTFQIHKNTSISTGEIDRGWGIVREAQRQAAKKLDHVFVIPTANGSMSDVIHNASPANIVLGERMAKHVLGHLYGRNIMCDSPDLVRAVKSSDTTIVLQFAHVYGALEWYNETYRGKVFRIEAEDRVIRPVSVRIESADTLEMEFAEKIPEDSVVHGGTGADISFAFPVDRATRNPMLAFYGVKVEEGSDQL